MKKQADIRDIRSLEDVKILLHSDGYFHPTSEWLDDALKDIASMTFEKARAYVHSDGGFLTRDLHKKIVDLVRRNKWSSDESTVRDQLVKLGSTNPEIRPHIRAVLASSEYARFSDDVSKGLRQNKRASMTFGGALRAARDKFKNQVEKLLPAAVGRMLRGRVEAFKVTRGPAWISVLVTFPDGNPPAEITISEVQTFSLDELQWVVALDDPPRGYRNAPYSVITFDDESPADITKKISTHVSTIVDILHRFRK
jgi:hypothetical protein